MPDPLDRLTVAKAKIDELFGAGFAQEHPEVLVAVIQSAASDWAAARIGAALEFIGRALLEPEEPPQRIVAPRELIRSR